MAFPTDFAEQFVRRFLPAECRRMLDVGCGSGELAMALSRDFEVVALDADDAAVSAAKAIRVDARLGKWPDFNDGEFDAILFIRSLHHIHSLEAAVRKTAETLRQEGRVIVDDFAIESVDEKSLRWFSGVLSRLHSAGRLAPDDDFLTRLQAKTESLNAWRAAHPREIHPASRIAQALGEVFEIVAEEKVPCFFRYLAKAIVPADATDDILRELCSEEAELARRAEIVFLGRRWAGTRKRS